MASALNSSPEPRAPVLCPKPYIDSWHTQAQVHGLRSLPSVWVLQVQRYGSSGQLLKGKIKGLWQVQIPYFSGANKAIARHPYQVHAITFNKGADVLQGCNRVALLQEGDLVFVTADGKRTAKIKPGEIIAVLQHAYLLFLGRCSTS